MAAAARSMPSQMTDSPHIEWVPFYPEFDRLFEEASRLQLEFGVEDRAYPETEDAILDRWLGLALETAQHDDRLRIVFTEFGRCLFRVARAHLRLARSPVLVSDEASREKTLAFFGLVDINGSAAALIVEAATHEEADRGAELGFSRKIRRTLVEAAVWVTVWELGVSPGRIRKAVSRFLDPCVVQSD